MTLEETITTLELAISEVEWNYPLDISIALETAIEALKKQIPRKPIKSDRDIRLQMTDRERLIELKINFVENFCCGDCKPSNDKCRKCLSEKESDYLLEHGVIVLPCKVGDTIYQTDGVRIYKSRVKQIIYDTDNIDFDERAIGKTVFLTREEAEKAAKERESNA